MVMTLRRRSWRWFLVYLALALAIGILVYGRPLLKQAFPIPFAEVILRAAEETGTEPLLLVAIMRVESSFNPHAESPKGAKGLMQVMPSTGAWVAERLGMSDFDVSRLEDPETNIQIGAWYFAYLKNLFDDNTIAALAAYNGGLGNVQRWLREEIWSGQVDDLMNIPFPETRAYVQKVLSTVEVYRMIHPEFAEEGFSWDALKIQDLLNYR